jgi:hypothetical protein
MVCVVFGLNNLSCIGSGVLTEDRPVLSSERAPHKDKTVTVKLNLISGHEPQMRLDTKTDRQSQCNFDSGSGVQGQGLALLNGPN